MSDEMITIHAAPGSDEQVRVIELVEWMRAAVMARAPGDNDPQFLALAMTAAAMFAGTIAGTIISAGLARDQDKKRMTDMMARNFREGIEVGKRRAMRIAFETMESGNA